MQLESFASRRQTEEPLAKLLDRDLEEFKLTETRQANVRITEPGAVATAFMVCYSFGSLKAVATAPGSVITLRLPPTRT